MPFRHTVTVRFFEIDRAGIVFFGRFFEYCHATFEELLMSAFGDLESIFRTSSWGMPLVHTESDHLRPVFIGERLTIELEVAALGGASITFAYRILGPDGDLRAKVTLKHAFVSRPDFQPIPMPGEFRDGLLKLGLTLPGGGPQ